MSSLLQTARGGKSKVNGSLFFFIKCKGFVESFVGSRDEDGGHSIQVPIIQGYDVSFSVSDRKVKNGEAPVAIDIKVESMHDERRSAKVDRLAKVGFPQISACGPKKGWHATFVRNGLSRSSGSHEELSQNTVRPTGSPSEFNLRK